MAKERLSKEKIEAYKPLKERYIVWDLTAPGLGLKVHPTGRKSFFVYFRLKSGEQRRPSLGEFDSGKTDMNEIRRLARAAINEAAAGEAVPSRKVAMTLREYATRYYASCELKGLKRPSTLAEEKRKLAKYILPALGNLKLEDIDRDAVEALHDSMADFPIQANRTYSTLRAILNQAIDGGKLKGLNPCRRIKMYGENGRDVTLDEKDISRLGAILDLPKIEYSRKAKGKLRARVYTMNPAIVASIKLLVFTGCRKSEIFGLAWNDVDLDGRRAHLRQTKTEPRDVVLNTPAMAVIRHLAADKAGDWLIPGRRLSAPMRNFQKQWEIIREAAGLNNFPLHGFRHSFSSIGANLGIPDTVRAVLLGHKLQGKTTVRYTHVSPNALRQASERIGQWIADALTGAPADSGAHVLDISAAGGEAADAGARALAKGKV